MSRRLFERPNTIEDLTETREYMKTIPEVHTALKHPSLV